MTINIKFQRKSVCASSKGGCFIIRKFLKDERGSVIVLLILFMAIFAGVGFIVSQQGLVYLSRSKLQNAVDAAALAAAQDMGTGKSWSAVESTAIEYVGKNITLDVTPTVNPYPNSGTTTGVTVTATQDVDYSLPGIFNKSGGTHNVTATATANTQTITGMNGLVPVVALKNEVDFPSNTNILLKGGSQDKFASCYEDNYNKSGPKGFRGLLSLDGKHGNNLGSVFLNGCEETITIGGRIDEENGNISGIASAVNQRAAISPIIYMPVVDTVMIDGVETVLLNKKNEVIVVGFAAFELDTTHPMGTGTEAQLYGHFVQKIHVADSSSLSHTNYYGLTTIKLIH